MTPALPFDDTPTRAPVLVLLHPFPTDARFFAGLRSALGSRVRLVTPDLPGFGRARNQLDAPTLEAMADRVAALLDDLGLSRVLLGGVSMGGYVALTFARRHPARLAGLALLNTRTAADSPAVREGREEGIQTVRARGVASFVEGLVGRLVGASASMECREAARTLCLDQSAEGVAQALGALRDRTDNGPALRGFEGPVLVLGGAEDVVTPSSEMRTMTELAPGAEWEEAAGAGHFLAFEKPAWTADRLAAWVASTGEGLPCEARVQPLEEAWRALEAAWDTTPDAAQRARVLATRVTAARTALFDALASSQGDAAPPDPATLETRQALVRQCTVLLGDVRAALPR